MCSVSQKHEWTYVSTGKIMYYNTFTTSDHETFIFCFSRDFWPDLGKKIDIKYNIVEMKKKSKKKKWVFFKVILCSFWKNQDKLPETQKNNHSGHTAEN